MFNFFFVGFSNTRLAVFMHFFLMTAILGWFLYFRITFKDESLILSIKSLLFEYLVSRFCSMYEKNYLCTSQIRFDNFTIFSQMKFALTHKMFYCLPKRVYCPESVVRMCSVKKVFLKMSQNSQENSCTRVSFLIKLLKPEACNFLKKNFVQDLQFIILGIILKNRFS